ncbi:MAG: phosphotransferase [Actinomycetota bacterium]|nr:phosphotransferase [Actinomycetota bacterium]
MNIDPGPLLAWLPHKRWFGQGDAPLLGIGVIDETILDDGPPALVLAIVSVNVAGRPTCYQLPLLVAEDGTVTDATDDPDRLKVFGELMSHGDSVKGEHGVFHFGGPGLDPMAPPPGSTSIRVVDAEQSNTSIVLDENVIFKFFRRVEGGENPDLELNRLLTSEGFDHVPPQVGEATYEGTIDGDELVMDLGIAQQLIPDASEGWTWLLAKLHKMYDEVDPADLAEDRAFLLTERSAETLDALGELGDVTASMHVALARNDSDPALVPEAMDETDLEALRDRISDSLELAPADALKGIARVIKNLPTFESAGAKIRIHGDYHLGQVLRSGRGWMVLDFEGEPLRSLDDRRAKQSPLKDVAGMLRSFNYAAIATLFERTDPDTDEWQRLQPWAETWESLARDRFLHTYLTRAHEGRFLPGDRAVLAVLLEAFEIEKALYELEYERGHRPDWVRIPERGIVAAIERSLPE